MTSTSIAGLASQAAALAGSLLLDEDPRLRFSNLLADPELAKALCRNCPRRRP